MSSLYCKLLFSPTFKIPGKISNFPSLGAVRVPGGPLSYCLGHTGRAGQQEPVIQGRVECFFLKATRTL